LLTLKAKPARQRVDNADLSWTWSVLRAVFVLKARPSWVKLKRHEWKRLWGFTARVLFNKTKGAREMVINFSEGVLGCLDDVSLGKLANRGLFVCLFV